MKTRKELPKLTLHRETLRQLENEELQEIAGGLTANTVCCPPTVPPRSKCIAC